MSSILDAVMTGQRRLSYFQSRQVVLENNLLFRTLEKIAVTTRRQYVDWELTLVLTEKRVEYVKGLVPEHGKGEEKQS